MAEPLTWPAVVMGVFTIVNGSVLVPVVRSWRRNRNAGQKRDVIIDSLAAEVKSQGRQTEHALAEFGSQLVALKLEARVTASEARVNALERELEHVLRKQEMMEARR